MEGKGVREERKGGREGTDKRKGERKRGGLFWHETTRQSAASSRQRSGRNLPHESPGALGLVRERVKKEKRKKIKELIRRSAAQWQPGCYDEEQGGDIFRQ